MSKQIKIQKNVYEFLEKAAKSFANLQLERFEAESLSYLSYLGMESPIEHIFFIALRLQCEEIGYEFNTDEDSGDYKGFRNRLSVYPQKQIGHYRVDFLIVCRNLNKTNQIIIELDGHDFHDKDKHQRSYEKARDRFLINSGYKVFHYTGSDVVSNPHHVVFEVIKSLNVPVFGTLEEHDPENRIGWDQDA